jgi:hypothetical protein
VIEKYELVNMIQKKKYYLDRLESLENTISMLKNVEIKPKKEEIYNIDIPSIDDINNIIEDKKEVKVEQTTVEKEVVDLPITSEEITIKEIENVLNNANKEKKEALLKVWNQISERYVNVFAVQIMVNGNIVAVSDDTFIVELQDIGFCNRVMKYENYVKIIEIFNEYNLNIKDYICVPKAIWNVIKKDYGAKYKSGILKPVLEDVRIGVKRRVVPTSETNNKLYDDIYELFDKESVRIVEE